VVLKRLNGGTTFLYPQQFVLTSPTSWGRSVGIVRSRTHATEFSSQFKDILNEMIVKFSQEVSSCDFLNQHSNNILPCNLVVRDPGYTSRGPEFDSRHYQISWEVVGLERGPLSLIRVPSSIPCITRFSEKQRVWSGVHSASWVQLRSYLEEKVAAPI
jgi:hypothetical protein